MKLQLLCLLSILFFFQESVLLCQENRGTNAAQETITVEKYCAFLNATSSSDPTNFYDGKMAGDLESASIQRAGSPGNYCYEVVGLGKNSASPMLFLSWNDVMRYCQWRNSVSSTSTFNLNSRETAAVNVDLELKSNRTTFCLARASLASTSSSSYHFSLGEDVLMLVAITAMIGGGAAWYLADRSPPILIEKATSNRNSSVEDSSFTDDSDEDFLNDNRTSPASHILISEQSHHAGVPILLRGPAIDESKREQVKSFIAKIIQCHDVDRAGRLEKADAAWIEADQCNEDDVKEKEKNYQTQCEKFEKVLTELLNGAEITSLYTGDTTEKNSYTELGKKLIGDWSSRLKTVATGAASTGAAHVPFIGPFLAQPAADTTSAVIDSTTEYISSKMPSSERDTEEILEHVTNYFSHQSYEDPKELSKRLPEAKPKIQTFLEKDKSKLKARFDAARKNLEAAHESLETTRTAYEAALQSREKARSEEESIHTFFSEESFSQQVREAKNRWSQDREAITIVKTSWGNIINAAIEEAEKIKKECDEKITIGEKNYNDATEAVEKLKENLENLSQKRVNKENPKLEFDCEKTERSIKQKEKNLQKVTAKYRQLLIEEDRTKERAAALSEAYQQAWEKVWLKEWPSLDLIFKAEADAPDQTDSTCWDILAKDWMTVESKSETAGEGDLEHIKMKHSYWLAISRAAWDTTLEIQKGLYEKLWKTWDPEQKEIMEGMRYWDEVLRNKRKVGEEVIANLQKISSDHLNAAAHQARCEADIAWAEAEKAGLAVFARRNQSQSTGAIATLLNFLTEKSAEEQWEQAAEAKRDALEKIEKVSTTSKLRSLLPIINFEILWAEAERLRWHAESAPDHLISFLSLEGYQVDSTFEEGLFESLDESRSNILETQEARNAFIMCYQENQQRLFKKNKKNWEGRFKRAQCYQQLDHLRIGYIDYRKTLECLDGANMEDDASKEQLVENAWENVLQTYEKIKDVLPQVKSALVKASLDALPLVLKAQKMSVIANESYSKASALIPDDPNFETVWNEAIRLARASEQPWITVVQYYQRLRNTLPENQQNTWNNTLDEAEFIKANCTINPLCWEAEKVAKSAEWTESKFKTLTHTQNSNFNESWDKVIGAVENAGQVWDEFAQSFQRLRETLPDHKRTQWDEDFPNAGYGRAFFMRRLLLLEAEKISTIANLSARKAVELTPNDSNFERAWSETMDATDHANNAWALTFQCYQALQKTLPQSEQSRLDEYFNVADIEYNTTHFAARSVVLKAQKADKLAETAQIKVQESHPQDSNFKDLLSEAISKACDAEQAWEGVILYSQKSQEILPQNQQTAWEKVLCEAKYKKAFYSISPLLLKSHKAVATLLSRMLSTAPENSDFDIVLDEVTRRAHEVESEGEGIIQRLKELRETVPEGRQAAWDNHLHQSEENKNSLAGLYSLLETQKMIQIAVAAQAQAQTVACQDPNFEEAWDEAISRARDAEKALTTTCQYLKETSGNQQVDWDKKIQSLEYQKAYYAHYTPVLWLEAEKESRVADEAKRKAQALSPQDTNFEEAWSEAITRDSKSKEAWASVFRWYQEFKEEQAECQQMKLDEKLHEAKYQQAFYSLRQLSLQAEKKTILAYEANNKVDRLANRASNFEETLKNALKEASDAKLAWNKVIQCKQELQATLSDRERARLDESFRFAEIEYSINYLTAQSLLLEAQKADKIAQKAINNTESILFNDAHFELAWNEVISRHNNAEQAWESALQYLQKLQENISGCEQSDWNKDIYFAKHSKIFSTAKLLWLETERKTKIAEYANTKAQTLTSEDFNVETERIWNEAISKSHEVKEAWAKTLVHFQESQKILPEDQQNTFDQKIHDAEKNEITYSITTLLLKAQKKEKLLQNSKNKARTLFPWDVNFETAWSEAISRAHDAKHAWENLVQYFKKLQRVPPEHQHVLNESLYNKAIAILQPLLLEMQREDKQFINDAKGKLEDSLQNLNILALYNETANMLSAAKQRWEDFFQLSQKLRKKLPENQREKWDYNVLSFIEHNKNLYTEPSLSLETLDKEQLIDHQKSIILEDQKSEVIKKEAVVQKSSSKNNKSQEFSGLKRGFLNSGSKKLPEK